MLGIFCYPNPLYVGPSLPIVSLSHLGSFICHWRLVAWQTLKHQVLYSWISYLCPSFDGLSPRLSNFFKELHRLIFHVVTRHYRRVARDHHDLLHFWGDLGKLGRDISWTAWVCNCFNGVLTEGPQLKIFMIAPVVSMNQNCSSRTSEWRTPL